MDGDSSDEGELLSALIDAFDSDNEDCGKAARSKPSISTEAVSCNIQRKLEEVDIFNEEEKATTNNKSLKSQLFGESDSEDEDAIVPEKKTALNENGVEIKQILKSSSSFTLQASPVTASSNAWKATSRTAHTPNTDNSIRDPILGWNIINPKVSMDFLRSCSSGKEKVLLSKAGMFGQKLEKEKKDWFTIGVIASKTETKRSAKSDKEYIIFRLADLSDVDTTSSLFLFGRSYHQHWKLPVASVIGLMNPTIMKSDKNADVTLSINDASQLMVIGTSKDFGTCRTMTKNGNPCTNIVNKAICDKCKYHVMKEHKATSHQRAELNSAHGSREPDAIRQRLLSKLSTTRSSDDCYTYAGKTYSTKAKPKTAVTLKGVLNRSVQKGNFENTLKLYDIKVEDRKRLQELNGEKKSEADEKLEELISRPSTASMQFVKHLIKKELNGASEKSAAVSVKSVSASDLLKMEKEKFQERMRAMKMKSNLCSELVVIDTPVSSSSSTKISAEEYKKIMMKKRAEQVIKMKGGLQKEDVNLIKKKLTSQQKESVKRKLDKSLNSSITDTEDESLRSCEETKAKKIKSDVMDINSQEYLALKERKSINAHLVKQVEDDRHSQYFNLLEKKDMYENKLLSTHFIEATLYYCPKCDYSDWKLSDLCFQEKHNYKKVQALKRFFKCSNCKERVTTHDKFPTKPCSKCGGTNFVKAGMINEKKVLLAGDELCIRGNEENKLGSFDSKVNLDIA